mmetsp:Transcript_125549/g.227691  ORF Transcript_125549/g.227691 Transcript_125549/m.227691 type:complete len:467 (-) Transcript_125549:123-1523(-)
MTAVTCHKISAMLFLAMFVVGGARRVQQKARVNSQDVQSVAEGSAASNAKQLKAMANFLLASESQAAFNPVTSAARSPVSSATLAASRPAAVMGLSAAPGVAEKMLQSGNRVQAKMLAALLKAKGLGNRLLPRKSAGSKNSGIVMQETKTGGVDVALLVCFALWYLGNYYYNITNKLALKAAGGAAGYPMTIATLQLGVGAIYALFLWLAPDARKKPTITFADYKKTLPVGFTAAGAHAASVFALSAGAVSFAQIVKAAEPAFAALVGTLVYGATVSTAKWLCLIPVIGGVCLASLGELDFAWAALITAAIANMFAAVKANENKKLMSTEGLKDRMGSVGNQYAITTINSFLFCLPLMFICEGAKFGGLMELLKTNPVVLWNMIFSGIWFYLYNELATLTIKKTGAVTQSVANTAKRVIVIVVVALVMGESLGFLKLLGCGIGIGGVFLYSIIDRLVGKKDKPAVA